MVISWVVILGLGIGMLAAVYEVTSVNGFRTGWQGIPVFLVLAGIAGRVANSKVILGEDVLTVVNPLRTHHLPKAAICDASVGDDGTLEVRLDGDRTVSVFAFGGSLVDRFAGSSEKAQRKIDTWLLVTSTGDQLHAADPQICWTRCPSADGALALSLALFVAGAIWMAFTGH
ncbi:PH domain-containing protein [Streptomyces sp. NPDC013171]|uniref:PH domain-containing protein n=1 Tax=Streptomyces sp. NPDC013171 TaxID=3364863 RepID=UPI00368B4E34